MSVLETIRTALESMASNMLRTLLTMLGVIIGVASVVTLMALGMGVQTSVSSQITRIGTNLLTVSADNRTSGARLTEDDVRALSNRMNVPDVVRVVAQVNGQLNVSAGVNRRNRSVVGTTPDFFEVRNISMGQGAPFTDVENDGRLRVAVLGYQVAQDLFPDQSAVGQTVLVGSVPFRVAGVTEKQGETGPGGSSDDTVYVPLTVAQEKLFAKRASGLKSVSSITAEAASSERSSAAATQIAETLRQQHGLLAGQADDFRVFDQASLIDTLNTVTGTLTAFLAAIGGISLLVGGIGIMNIMLVSVTERTREIGLRKAVGAQAGTIRLQFLVEALVVTCMAGVIGVLLAAGLSWIIGQVQTSIVPLIQPSAVLIAFGVSVLIGVVFGFYPAWRASRMSPVEALRYE